MFFVNRWFKRSYGVVTLIYCPYCKSPYVKYEVPEVQESSDKHTEVYKVQCTSCKAKGSVIESWDMKQT